MTVFKFVSIAGVSLASAVALANEPLQTEEVLVTATRTATPLVDTLAPVSVLTAADIAQLQAPDVPSLINGLTGVDMLQRGGRGANSSAFVRGSNSGHLLVLVDGVRVGSATLGATALETLDPDAIERIELVRGPRSSLYGSDAIGGILQIFTRKAEQPGTQVTFGARYGSHNEQQYRANVGFKSDQSHANLVLTHHRTDGFDRTLNESVGNGDNDASSANRLALSAGHDFSEALSLEANLQYQQGEADTDNSWCAIDCRPFARFANGSADVALHAQVSELWRTQVRAGWAQDKSEQDDHVDAAALLNSGGRNRIETERQSLSWQNDFALNEVNLLTLGVDFVNDSVDGKLEQRNYAPDWSYTVSFVGYDVEDRSNTGAFAQWQTAFGAHSFVLAARTDDNQQFGSADTGSISYRFDVSEAWALLASYGTAFKAPTFNDLYWPNSGNPDLDPETSRNRELGFRYQQNDMSLAFNIFENAVDDLIAWAPNAAGQWQPSNISEANITGAEAELTTRAAGWQLALNYTVLDAEDQATGNALPNRADQLFNADLSRAFGDVTLGLVVEARSARYADAANSTQLGGYGLLNLRAAWALTPALSLEAKVNNLLDKDYTLATGFRQDGANGFVGARYRF